MKGLDGRGGGGGVPAKGIGKCCKLRPSGSGTQFHFKHVQLMNKKRKVEKSKYFSHSKRYSICLSIC